MSELAAHVQVSRSANTSLDEFDTGRAVFPDEGACDDPLRGGGRPGRYYEGVLIPRADGATPPPRGIHSRAEVTTEEPMARDEHAGGEMATDSEQAALQKAAESIRQRLATRGVRLLGDESGGELAELLDAVERFEVAVQQRGGDLMVDEEPDELPDLADPDDPRFVLPVRADDETLAGFIQRIDAATWELQRDETT